MRIFSIIILGLFLSSCAVKTKIVPLDGGGYEVTSKRNAYVIYKKDRFAIDLRGKPSYLELILATIIGDTKKSVHVEMENLDDKETD